MYSFTENRFAFRNANEIKSFHGYVNWTTVIEYKYIYHGQQQYTPTHYYYYYYIY